MNKYHFLKYIRKCKNTNIFGEMVKCEEFQVSSKGSKINNTLDEIILHFLFSNDLFINCVTLLPLLWDTQQ